MGTRTSTQPGRGLSSPPPPPPQVLAEEEALRLKENGSRFFANKDLPSALQSYRKALACLPSELYWPRQERLALTLHSNIALCLLKLRQQPQLAAQECQKAQELPVFSIQAPSSMREKVLARHAEALLDWRDAAASTTMEEEQNNSPPSDAQIWSVLEQGRAQGYLSSSQTTATRIKFLQLGARLWDTKKGQQQQQQEQNYAIAGLHAWTDHFVRSGLITVQQAAQARQKVQQKQKKNTQALLPTCRLQNKRKYGCYRHWMSYCQNQM